VPRAKTRFKHSDIVRGLKAGQKLGIDFSVRVEPDGSLMFVRADDKKQERKPPKGKEWPSL